VATISSLVASEPSYEEGYVAIPSVHSKESLTIAVEIVLEVISVVLLVESEEVLGRYKSNKAERRVQENVDKTEVPDARKEAVIITLDEKPDPEVFLHKDLRNNKTTLSPITKRMHGVIVSVMEGQTGLIRSQHDLFTLTGHNWLNDQVVETYLNLVAGRSLTEEFRAKHLPRVHCMSTFFFRNLSVKGFTSVARWTKDVNLFSYDLVLVPVLVRKHWALVTMDFRTQGVFLYDSLVREGKKMFSHTPVLASIMEYLQLEQVRVLQEATDYTEADMKKSYDDHREPLKSSGLNLSKFALHSLPCPRQENGSDCGVFLCQVAEYLSRGEPLDFGQKDVAYFRRKMIWEIIRNRILDPSGD